MLQALIINNFSDVSDVSDEFYKKKIKIKEDKKWQQRR
jgi:hypothetical protein